jgi:hypothetical protein
LCNCTWTTFYCKGYVILHGRRLYIARNSENGESSHDKHESQRMIRFQTLFPDVLGIHYSKLSILLWLAVQTQPRIEYKHLIQSPCSIFETPPNTADYALFSRAHPALLCRLPRPPSPYKRSCSTDYADCTVPGSQPSQQTALQPSIRRRHPEGRRGP